MPYIYKITNQINNRIYIGKTINSIEDLCPRRQRDKASAF